METKITGVNMNTLPERIKVTVTSEDIEMGRRGSHLRCPIAQALKRRFPECIAAAGLSRIALWMEGNLSSHYYPTSERMVEFIGRFDKRLPVEPSTFVVTKAT